MTTADQVLSDFDAWVGDSAISSQSHLLTVALLQALLASSDAGGDSGSGLIVLAVFRATGLGDGYSTGDLVLLRQTPPAAPEYYNATTNAVIATPDPTELGSVSTASNVIVTSGLITLADGTNNIGGVDVISLPVDFNAGPVSDATQRVILASDQAAVPVALQNSADVVMQSGATATGNGTTLPSAGYGSAVIQITGTFVGTVTFESTVNGTDWVSASATVIGTSTIATTASAAGVFRLSCSGLTSIRARISAYTSGSITAVGRATNAPYGTKAVAVASLPVAFNAGEAGATTQRVILATNQAAVPLAVAFSAGIVDAATQRVVLASDGPAVANLAQIAAASRGTLSAHNTSAANAAATFTIAAPGASIAIQLVNIYFGYSTAPTNGTLTIFSTGLTSIVIPVTASGAGFLNIPVRAVANTALTVTLSAGGSGVVGNCSAIYSTVAA